MTDFLVACIRFFSARFYTLSVQKLQKNKEKYVCKQYKINKKGDYSILLSNDHSCHGRNASTNAETKTQKINIKKQEI